MSSDPSLDARLSRFRTRGEGAAELARALLDAGRPADALEVTSVGLKAAPSDASLLVLAGRARLATGDLFGAEGMLLRAVRAAPERAEVLSRLGEVLLARGDTVRATKALERGVALDPGDAAMAALLEQARSGERPRRAPASAPAPAPAEPAPAEAASAQPAALERLDHDAVKHPARPPLVPAFVAPAIELREASTASGEGEPKPPRSDVRRTITFGAPADILRTKLATPSIVEASLEVSVEAPVEAAIVGAQRSDGRPTPAPFAGVGMPSRSGATHVIAPAGRAPNDAETWVPTSRRAARLARWVAPLLGLAGLLGAGLVAFVAARALGGGDDPPALSQAPRSDTSAAPGPEAPAAQALRVVSEPPGARVHVDGRPSEGVTPLVMPLPAGARQVWLRLSKPGYVDQEREVSAAAGEARFVLSPVSAHD